MITRYSSAIATIGVAVGCLWLAAGSAAKPFAVRSFVVSPISASAHPQGTAPSQVAIPFRTFDPAELQAARQQAHQQYLNSRQPSAAPARQTPLGPQTAIFGGLSWSGLTAVPAGDFTPPDGGAGIGPGAFIEAINSEIAMYNRTTTALITPGVSLATFTGGNEPCDPYLMWDNGAQRWVVISIECTDTSSHTIYLDFSKSANPANLSTDWCQYSFDSGSQFPDYPKAGHNSSDWLVGTNDYSISTGNFDTAQLWAFEKPANGTITTCPAIHADSTSTSSQLKTVDGHSIFTPDASDQLDSGAPPSGTASDTGYFVSYELPGGSSANEINVIAFNRDASGTAHFTPEGDIPVTAYTFPGGVPQPGAMAGDVLDPSDTRGLGATSHVDPTRCSGCEAVWVEHAINGPGGRSQIQWDEVDPAACTGASLCGSPALLQDGLLSSSSLFYWNPRISPDEFGNEAVMNFNAGSATQLPEIMAVSNTPADAAGATRDPIVIQTSSNPDDDFSCPSQTFKTNPCRWGDYPAAEADPLNPGVVWNNSMFTASAPNGADAQWGTQNFAIRPAGPATNLTVSLAPASIVANGTAHTVAKATVTDGSGTPVQGETVTFSSTDTGDHIGAVTDNHDGTYTATVTSSTTADAPTITATDNSVIPGISGQRILTQTPGPATTVGVRLSPTSIAADGTSQSTATATITDAHANPVAGERVSFASTDSGNRIGPVTDNGDGTYSATVTSSRTAGIPIVTATDNSVAPAVSGHGTLTQTPDTAASVAVQLSPSSIFADGSSQSTATATITDAQGHPIAGDPVSFASTDGGEHVGAVTDHHDGTYTATITSSTTAGDPTITATDNAVPAVSGHATLTQTAGPATTVGLQLSPSSLLANGSSQSTATATITDAHGRPIAGDQVSFASTDGGNHVGPVTDNHNGTYVATITSSTTAGAPTITATDSSVSPPLSAHATLTQTPGTGPPPPPNQPNITNLTASHHKFRVGNALATLASARPAIRQRVALATVSIVELARLLAREVATLVGPAAQAPVATAAKVGTKPPVGTVFSFNLNTVARVQLAFAQTLPGRKVGGKCVAQSKQNAGHAKCTRRVPQGSPLTFAGHPGTDRVSFAGRLSRTKKLVPGNYKMTLTASNSAGRSTPKTISFTVV